MTTGLALEHLLPTPEALQDAFPLDEEGAAFVQESREAVEAIINGEDSRLLLIAGPCSIHDPEAAFEYGQRLKQLSERVADRFFVVMRTYFEKPRTIIGWKGMLYDPDLDGSHDLAKGITETRKLLGRLTDIQLPVGCELLEINTSSYYTDFLTWGCIGARTSSSPPHRQLAAGLNFPIGFKNSVEGTLDQAVHGIVSASMPHTYLGLSSSGQLIRIEAPGNPSCHVVLRGGRPGPNYHAETIQAAVAKCQETQVCDRVVIDCSHDNCGKNVLRQVDVFQSVIDQVCRGNRQIAGLMLESHLQEGAQEISFPLRYGVSITDPCLDWPATERCILNAYSQLINF